VTPPATFLARPETPDPAVGCAHVGDRVVSGVDTRTLVEKMAADQNANLRLHGTAPE